MVEYDDAGQGYWDFILEKASVEMIETVKKIIKENDGVQILKAYENVFREFTASNVVLETNFSYFFLHTFSDTKEVKIEKISKLTLTILEEIKGGKLL